MTFQDYSTSKKNNSLLYGGLLAIWLFSLMIRFWKLGQFNELVFDEVYYAKFANDYLRGKEFFNAHPPLSQYIIAIGIWLKSLLETLFPESPSIMNNLTGSTLSTLSYRWLNAFTGSFLPLVTAGIAYQLTERKLYTFLTAFLVSLDGLILVESRYALNNIYLVLFGLLGHLFLLKALKKQENKYLNLGLSGVFFGASACIKWNGLWFLLGAYLFWGIVWFIELSKSKSIERFFKNIVALLLIGQPSHVSHHKKFYFLNKITSLSLPVMLFFLGVIPVATYSLLWIPHLKMNPQFNFWEMQYQILTYHERIQDGKAVHPYCSDWYTWIMMIRPVAYYYKAVGKDGNKLIYDVHAMGNPLLWWFATFAVILLMFFLLSKRMTKRKFILTPETGIALYLVTQYWSNLLPWIPVTRCTFIYHYMGASLFAMLSLGWLLNSWLTHSQSPYKSLGLAMMILITLGFIFWLPIYLGLPLSVKDYNWRMFFPSWI